VLSPHLRRNEEAFRKNLVRGQCDRATKVRYAHPAADDPADSHQPTVMAGGEAHVSGRQPPSHLISRGPGDQGGVFARVRRLQRTDVKLKRAVEFGDRLIQGALKQRQTRVAGGGESLDGQ
jgi:hypothetical protein